MAGVIDLKGRLDYKNNRQRKSRQVVLGVHSKEIQVIRRLSQLTGTQPENHAPKPLREFMRKGCDEHCPEKHIHVGDEFLQMPAGAKWTITGAGMVVVLTELMPYLTIDRGYPETIEEVYATVALVGQGAAAVLSSLRRLRNLGWDMPPMFEARLEQLDNTRAIEAAVA